MTVQSKRSRLRRRDPGDAPEITDKWIAGAVLHHGKKSARHGRVATLGRAQRPIIRAGLISEVRRASREWIYVDVGFAQDTRKSCGLLESLDRGATPALLTFVDLKARFVKLVRAGDTPVNLVIETPLSVAFSAAGNPVGRSIEQRNGKCRYWHVGLGCSVLVSASYLLRAIADAPPTREVRLFEGLVSFKPRGITSDHGRDVLDLRRVVLGEVGAGGFSRPKSCRWTRGTPLAPLSLSEAPTTACRPSSPPASNRGRLIAATIRHDRIFASCAFAALYL